MSVAREGLWEGGTLVEMEIFCILTVSVSMSWLGCGGTVLGDAALGELGQGHTGSPYSFLKLHACESVIQLSETERFN